MGNTPSGRNTTATQVVDAYLQRIKSQGISGTGATTSRVAVLTGAHSGIGTETLKALVRAGWFVVCGGRDATVVQSKVYDLLDKDDLPRSQVACYALDLGDMETIRAFAGQVLQKHPKVDVLVNNAGIAGGCSVTKQGLERTVGVNVVGTFLLTELLIPALKASDGGGRVVNVASIGYRMRGAPRMDFDYYASHPFDGSNSDGKYDTWLAYQQSKLGNMLHAKELVRRHNIDAVSLHPGAIATNLTRDVSVKDMFSMIFGDIGFLWKSGERPKNVEQGAATTVTVTLAETVSPGGFYQDCAETTPEDNALNEEDAAKLYDWCLEVTKEHLTL